MKIPGYSFYDIDENGTVVETATGEEIQHRLSGKYAWVYIVSDEKGKRAPANLHVLLALAFCGERPDGYVASFIDGDPTNVHASNVCWRSRRDINAEKSRNRRPKANHSNTPESRELIYETLKMLDKPVFMVELAEILDLPYSTIRYSMYHLIGEGKVHLVRGGYMVV